MKRGFTILEVLLAALILGFGLTAILVSFSQGRKMMLASSYLETAHEVMELGEIAFPLDDVTSADDLDTGKQSVEDLWSIVAGAHGPRMSDEQEDKFKGYSWERKRVDKNPDADEVKRMGGLHPVRITVRWGSSLFNNKFEEETYIVLWKEPNS